MPADSCEQRDFDTSTALWMGYWIPQESVRCNALSHKERDWGMRPHLEDVSSMGKRRHCNPLTLANPHL